ncbi:MAG: beta-lactamase family protein [Planctomycetes bacterium]|nr:beta-lactamase family protein [Planctomycetota bacterium]MBI3845417.1 beta-lactamase family protein [Planctomycetota bacterium]
MIVTLFLCMQLAALPDDDVDATVRSQLDKLHVPGISVAVVKDGVPLFSKSYGLANVELGVAATPDTPFEILSVGKQFTAAAVMLLVQEGKVGLDDPVAKHLLDSPEAWSGVTLRHLLTHTSGIRSYHEVPGYFDQIRLDRTPQQLLQPVRALPLDFQPGTAWRYSNSNYFLLGLVIEKVTGKAYADFLDERLFRPLDMKGTRVNDHSVVLPRRAAGYTWRNDRLWNADVVSASQMWAAGGVVSTAPDLAKWEASLFSAKLLPKSVVEQMATPARLMDGRETDYGFGNEVGVDHGHRFAGHQGGAIAFDATVLRFPSDGLSVIVLCNLTQAPSRTIARHIASLYLPGLSDEKNAGIEDGDPKTTSALRDVVLGIASGKIDRSPFTESAQKGLVPMIEKQGPRLLGRLGKLESFVLLERRGDGGTTTHRYRATFEKGKLVWEFRTTADGKIESIEPPTEE